MESSPLSRKEAGEGGTIAHKRPFVERRRRKAIEESWPEALDSVQRYLLGFEQAIQRMQEQESKYRGLFDRAPIGIFQVSSDGTLLNLNHAMARIFGYESPESALEDVTIGDSLIPGWISKWEQACPGAAPSLETASLEIPLVTPGRQTKWLRLHIRALKEGEHVTRFEGTAEDITERKLLEARTQALAYYDQLTGLPNRTLFQELLTGTLESCRARSQRAALVHLEIDRFRVINDSLGAAIGNRLLQEIAARIRAGTGENVIAARVGSAEFALLLSPIAHTEELESEVKSIVGLLNEEHSFLGHALDVSCNAGISVFPENGTDCTTLMSRADAALCFSRESSATPVRMFTEEMDAKLSERLALDHGLRRALTLNELYLVYQPQVDLRTGAITGLEALLRWQHRWLGLIPPNKFIGVAENSGLIVPIGEWVLRSACTQARAWQRKGLPAVPIAVNVSAVQFRQQDFCELVRKVLEETGLDPKLLELELTESMLLTNADQMSSITSELRRWV